MIHPVEEKLREVFFVLEQKSLAYYKLFVVAGQVELFSQQMEIAIRFHTYHNFCLLVIDKFGFSYEDCFCREYVDAAEAIDKFFLNDSELT